MANTEETTDTTTEATSPSTPKKTTKKTARKAPARGQRRPTKAQQLEAENERLRRELEQVRAAKYEQLVAMNVRIPKGLRDRARDYALSQDITIKFVVQHALTAYLDAREAEQQQDALPDA